MLTLQQINKQYLEETFTFNEYLSFELNSEAIINSVIIKEPFKKLKNVVFPKKGNLKSEDFNKECNVLFNENMNNLGRKYDFILFFNYNQI